LRLFFYLFGFSLFSVLFFSSFFCIKNQRRDGYLSFLFPFNPALYVMKTGEPRGLGYGLDEKRLPTLF
jgi:hypothetical protein